MTETKAREIIDKFATINGKIPYNHQIMKSINFAREFADRIDWNGVAWQWLLPDTEDDVKLIREFMPKELRDKFFKKLSL